VVSFIGGGNTRNPPVCRKSLTNFITYCCIEYTSPWTCFKLTTSVVICTDCIGSCKSNCHSITTTTVPHQFYEITINYFCLRGMTIYLIVRNKSHLNTVLLLLSISFGLILIFYIPSKWPKLMTFEYYMMKLTPMCVWMSTLVMIFTHWHRCVCGCRF
jgi:hypothetical protein